MDDKRGYRKKDQWQWEVDTRTAELSEIFDDVYTTCRDPERLCNRASQGHLIDSTEWDHNARRPAANLQYLHPRTVMGGSISSSTALVRSEELYRLAMLRRR